MAEEMIVLLVVAQGLVDFLVVALLICVLSEVDKVNTAIAALQPEDEIKSCSKVGDAGDQLAPSDGAPAPAEGQCAVGSDEAAPAFRGDVRVSAGRKGTRTRGTCRVTAQPRRTCRCPRCLDRSRFG